jgi:hypothetical protein
LQVGPRPTQSVPTSWPAVIALHLDPLQDVLSRVPEAILVASTIQFVTVMTVMAEHFKGGHKGRVVAVRELNHATIKTMVRPAPNHYVTSSPKPNWTALNEVSSRRLKTIRF